MADKYAGSLATIFKHLALGELIQTIKPAEYWESHAGSAFYEDSSTAETLHDVHFFAKAPVESNILRLTAYHRLLRREISGNGAAFTRIPGSPALAHELLTGHPRRLLFCHVDAHCLLSIKDLKGNQQIVECVQDDGVSVTRGAVMLLPDPWPASTLAFIDPENIDALSDAGITPLQLWCEMASRGILAVLCYSFANTEQRFATHQNFKQAMEKSRLVNRGTHRYEGTLKIASDPLCLAPWGFGLLTAHLPLAARERLDMCLRALEMLYAQASPSAAAPKNGAWIFTRAEM